MFYGTTYLGRGKMTTEGWVTYNANKYISPEGHRQINGTEKIIDVLLGSNYQEGKENGCLKGQGGWVHLHFKLKVTICQTKSMNREEPYAIKKVTACHASNTRLQLRCGNKCQKEICLLEKVAICKPISLCPKDAINITAGSMFFSTKYRTECRATYICI